LTYQPQPRRVGLTKLTNDEFQLLTGGAQAIPVVPTSVDKPSPSLQNAATSRFVSVLTDRSAGSGVWIAPNRMATIAHVIQDTLLSSSITINLAKFRVSSLLSSNRSLSIRDSSYIIDVLREYGNKVTPKKDRDIKKRNEPQFVAQPDLEYFSPPTSEIALSSPVINGSFANLFLVGPDGVIPLQGIDVHGPMIVFDCPKAKPGYSGSPIFGVRDGKICLIATLSCKLANDRIGAVCFARDPG